MNYIIDTGLTMWLPFGVIKESKAARSHKSSASSFRMEEIFYQWMKGCSVTDSITFTEAHHRAIMQAMFCCMSPQRIL